MNVASLEICKELYELSGWDDTDNYYEYGREVSPVPGVSGMKTKLFHDIGWLRSPNRTPAYDLGYLLRKLPHPLVQLNAKELWHAGAYGVDYDLGRLYILIDAVGEGSTPEDAACALANQLFKKRILEREAGDAK